MNNFMNVFLCCGISLSGVIQLGTGTVSSENVVYLVTMKKVSKELCHGLSVHAISVVGQWVWYKMLIQNCQGVCVLNQHPYHRFILSNSIKSIVDPLAQ